MENREVARSKSETAKAERLHAFDQDEIGTLRLATGSWVEGDSPRLLEHWLARSLDPSGVPIRVPIRDWATIVVELARARRAKAGWPDRCDARIAQLIEAVLRFSRPTGIPATTELEQQEAPEIRNALRAWALAFTGTGAARVVSMWFPRRDDDESSPPPLPAWSSEKQPLAILRAEWHKTGDFLAVDHRAPGPSTTFELFGGGKPWLGPKWALSLAEGEETSRPKLQTWSTSWMADLFEWSFRAGSAQVTRTALLLRGRQLALMADQVDFRGGDDDPRPVSLKLAHNPAVRMEGDEESRTLILKRSNDRSSARAYPLALPCLPYKTDKGSFHASDGNLVLTQARSSRRLWLPVLVSWDAVRNRKPIQWRALTVSEKSKICPPEVAVAVRARWGPDETIVIYRSLAKPGLRAFLGHQTKARFLVGTFSNEGVVKPLISLD